MPRKRASNGQGHIRQRTDGRWEAQILLPPDPSTGKQKRKSIYGKTEGEVAKKLRKVSVEVDNGSYTEPSKLTVGQWLDTWHKEYLGNVKPHTVSQYGTQIDHHLKPRLGHIRLIQLSPHMIQGMYNGLLRKEGQKEGISPKSIRNINGVLHSAMEKAIALGYITSNPTKGCTLPRVERREMHTIKDDDVTRFMEAIKGHKYEAIYLVDMFTGMRQGEILGLTWDCIDFDGGVVVVNKQLQKSRGKGGQYHFSSLKNDKPRKVPASSYVLNILRTQRRKQIEWQLQAGNLWNNPMNLVFTNEFGGHLTGVTIYNRFKQVVCSLGLDSVRFHDLRHTFALFSLQNGDSMKTVQQSLGHATVAFTLDVYGHVSEKMQRESAARMDAFINTLTANKS